MTFSPNSTKDSQFHLTFSKRTDLRSIFSRLLSRGKKKHSFPVALSVSASPAFALPGAVHGARLFLPRRVPRRGDRRSTRRCQPVWQLPLQLLLLLPHDTDNGYAIRTNGQRLEHMKFFLKKNRNMKFFPSHDILSERSPAEHNKMWAYIPV